ncbi:MAG: glutamate--cysteine ligase [Gammaproteobacteria bacterium]|jgi:gamma-glutamyl:cysteine ligase YbdK (ATP-grasp superfamily)
MGDEIKTRDFTQHDFAEFSKRLRVETELLAQLFRDRGFSHRGPVAGFELEAWLVDRDGNPLPINRAYLDRLGSSLAVPELAAFNFELNGSPTALTGRAFSRLHDELSATWSRCRACAETFDCDIVAIGTLPTVTADDLTSEFMSDMIRYHALNDQLLELRHGRPFEIRIDGREKFRLSHPDVMMEAGATSFQIHLQVRPQEELHAYNASVVIAAPMVAVAANSPLFCGHVLWDETRIPLFEQAVAVGMEGYPRVCLGHEYARGSLYSYFEENLDHYPVLIPAVNDDPEARFYHVRFHNGTIWRWNRPLIGFDFDGLIHLRIEHRVCPAGPSLRDCVANAAFYYGLVYGLLARGEPIEQEIDFAMAKDNFYRAARDGLAADVHWTDGTQVNMRELVLDELLTLAEQGLERLGIPLSEIGEYLGVIEARVVSRLNGAEWQRRWIERHGRDMKALTQAYIERQHADKPVHEWSVE